MVRWRSTPLHGESVTNMARTCCLAAIAPEDTLLLTTSLESAVEHAETSVVQLDIAVLNMLSPDILVVDIDELKTDPLEALRQVRFILPDCIMVVYTNSTEPSVVRACHNAGANCLLSKSSDEAQLTSGLRNAIFSGCFTDPRFSLVHP
jgi:DNA-binding NarL/FixJ family response regulator